MQFLENEAYKAKLPTILQSRDRPHIIYSWAGGVLKAQIEAGVLEDITAAVGGLQGQSRAPAPSRRSPTTARSTACRMRSRRSASCTTRSSSPRPASTAPRSRAGTTCSRAVKTLKAAGVTPIAVGGADKWPLHFYWTHLAVRLGGKPAFEAALKGQNGGFEGETFQKSGELFKQLVDLQPFQNGFLGFKNPQALGYFGDGKAAMNLAISYHLRDAARARRRQAGHQRREARLVRLSRCRPARKGEPTDTLGGINGWLITKGAPKEAVEFVKFFISKDVQTRLAQANYLIPTYKGAEAGLGAPFLRNIAQNIARSNYHQNFYDQALGPSVGRVVNDATAEIAGGSMTPKQAAKAIQDACKQGN